MAGTHTTPRATKAAGQAPQPGPSLLLASAQNLPELLAYFSLAGRPWIRGPIALDSPLAVLVFSREGLLDLVTLG